MFLKKKSCFVLLTIVGVCCAGLQVKAMAQPREPADTGPKDYFTGDKVPGDPANEVTVMKLYYQCVQIYRKNHDGSYPNLERAGFLFDEIMKHPTVYGLAEIKDPKNVQEFFRPFVNFDNQYLDGSEGKIQPGMIDTQMPNRRKDGNAFGSPKPQGTRDVLAHTSLYIHQNGASFKQNRRRSNPVGFYMVLWDDGEIEKIPYDQILYLAVPSPSPEIESGTAYQVAFRGEAGIPADCITYEEFHDKSFSHKGPQTPPIGFPLAPGQTEPKPDNGGIESLVTLTRLENQDVDRPQIWDSLGHQVKDFTLNDLQAGATKLKFSLEKKTISLDELQKLHTPAILHLNSVWDIVTVPAMDDNFAIVCYQGATLIVATQKLAELYGGTALVPANVTQPLPLQVDNAVRAVTFNSDLDDVPQKVTFTNTGAKPISLTLERPICGVTKAGLSQSQIAAGQSATLELNFEWRDFLPGNKQSTFVMIRTDDPMQPVLQLGFELQLKDGK